MNICQSHLGTEVHCPSVSTDGYAVENLTQNDVGFMVSHFVKPPVDVTFSFPVKVEVKDIFIHPSIGRQKSIDFEIFSASVNNEGNIEKNLADSLRGVTFWSIGKGFDKSGKAKLFHFENRLFRARYDFSSYKLPSWITSTDVESRPLRQTAQGALTAVTHLCIRLKRTEGSSVPCIRKICITGQPSRSNPRDSIEKFLKQAKNEKSLNAETPSIFGSEKSEKDASSNSNSILKKIKETYENDKDLSTRNEPYPEDFLDPLTFDLMPMPVTLPSGHTIDQTTLEKFCEAEAKWGRFPNDPFTGIQFTEKSKPVPNVKLKARIDKFLLGLGREIDHLPRRVGRGKSSDICAARTCKALKRLDGGVERTLHDIAGHVTSNCEGRPHKDNIFSSATSSTNFQKNNRISQLEDNRSKRLECNKRKLDNCESVPPSKTELDVEELHDNVAHKRKLTDSLNEALRQTLGGHAPYSPAASTTRDKSYGLSKAQNSLHAEQGETSYTRVCVSCQSSETKQIYEMGCGDCVCRRCLSRLERKHGEYVCSSCKKPSSTALIKRVHCPDGQI